MNQYCECGGNLLRHGFSDYAIPTIIGVRYICKECKKSKTVRMRKDEITGIAFLNETGRPTKRDWRFEFVRTPLKRKPPAKKKREASKNEMDTSAHQRQASA